MTSQEEKQFNEMLNTPEIRKKYKVQKGEDGTYEIPCRSSGDIEPYSLTELCCYSKVIKKNLPVYCKITQQCSREMVFKFPFAKLDEIAELVGARKKKTISEETRARLIQYSFPKKHTQGEEKQALKARIAV
jgi:hypothetical protein